MIAQSGFHDISRGKWMTSLSVRISHSATDETVALAITVPIAAPCVPNAGIGPAPRIRITFRAMFSTVMPAPM